MNEGALRMQQSKEYKVSSLAKAVHVLEAFSVKTPELGVSEIAQMLSYHKSTVFNILSTYEKLGYVAQNAQTGKYYLDLKLLHFTYVINSHMGFKKFFQEPMTKIAQMVGEVCYLGVPHEHSVLYIDAAFPQVGSNFRSITGETAPMYCTGLGKAMLAFLPPEEQEQVLALPRIKYTDYTITELSALKENLDEIRRNGFAVDNMEHEFGIRCVAVPVFGADQRLVAAVSVSGPSLRFDPVSIMRAYQTINELVQPLQMRL